MKSQAAAGLRAGLIGFSIAIFALGAVVLVVVASFSCSSGRRLDAPLYKGMTVLELGRARPTEYSRDREFGEYPAARDATAAQLSRFTGDLVVRQNGRPDITLPFFEGRRIAFDSPPAISAALLKRIPKGSTVKEALRHLPAAASVRLIVQGEAAVYHHLPAESARLARYSGTLEALEVSGWFTVHIWEVTFRDGRVIEIEERVEEWD